MTYGWIASASGCSDSDGGSCTSTPSTLCLYAVRYHAMGENRFASLYNCMEACQRDHPGGPAGKMSGSRWYAEI